MQHVIRYNPYALISDMRGLGAFVPPAVIPDPRVSEESARAFMEIWIAWAAAREDTIRRWAETIDKLIATRTATCEAIRLYNDAAIAHFVAEVEMGERFITLGGVSQSELPPPFFPLVFASSTRTKSIDFKNFDWPTGRLTIEYTLPCPPADPFGPNPKFTFPDYSKLRSFGDPRDTASTKTPSGLGLPPVAWAAIVLGGVILGGTVVLSIRAAFRGMNNTDLAEINREIEDLRAEVNSQRAQANQSCVEESLRLLEGKVSVDVLSRIRSECADGAERLFPDPKRVAEPRSTGVSILLAGVGVAAVVLSVAYLRSRKQED